MRATTITRLLVIGSITIPWMFASEASNSDLERRFAQTVRPFLTSYCVGCHGGPTPAAQFDLRSYSTMATVGRAIPDWRLVLEKLTAQEMPPKQAKQPSADARQVATLGLQAMPARSAAKNAGDPGR